MKILVTGGTGFIGSAVIRHLLRETGHHVVNLDKLTYAANPASLDDVADDPRYRFERADIGDAKAVRNILGHHRPGAIMHLAAETHVDRSIDAPAEFLETNVTGTYTLLEAALDYYKDLTGDERTAFRFHHVSTDEVYGSLGPEGAFDEGTPYAPRSPYAASKAASDHMVMAWHHTFGLPVVLSNTSNNYGPRQFPEKLIPLTILNALAGKPLAVYGTGENVRDWLFVDDHASALLTVLERGRIGETYMIGGDSERRNIEVVEAICELLDENFPDSPVRPHAQLITLVEDRPGHDLRYAVNGKKIDRELGWRPRVAFAEGLRRTVQWYVENRAWWEPLTKERYQGDRLGLTRFNDARRAAQPAAKDGRS